MDIEGAEPETLNGSIRIIQKHSPVLAISVYHQFDHLWKLPLLIKSLSEQYSFFLRPYRLAHWDLVCYAIPTNRIIRQIKI